jgi:putative MATE family efflux protein
LKRNEADLGNQSVGRLLFRLALPAITAQLINVLYNIVDRMYIGHIPVTGTDALTGVGVTMPAIMAISAFAALVSMGGAPRASIMMGRGDNGQAERVLGNCTTMLVIMASVLTAVFLIFGRQILMVFGASGNTIGYAWDYMQIYAVGTVFVQLALGLNAFISAQGYAKTSMFTVLIGAVCNIILDPIFIFAFDMGVRGAALATIISQAVSSIWVLKFLTSKKSLLTIRRENLRLCAGIILPCLALGVSPFIMQFTESVLFVCFNSSLLKYGGDIAVGSMTILASVMQFSMLPLQGLTQGAQPIISFNYGAMKAERVKKAFRILLFSCLIYSAALWSVSMFAPRVFASMFTNDSKLIEYSVWAIRIYMASSLLFGAQIACQQAFIALGNAKASIFLALLRKVILLIPLIFILPAFVSDKVMGVFLAEPIADFTAVCVTTVTFLVSFRRLMNGMTEKNTEPERTV